MPGRANLFPTNGKNEPNDRAILHAMSSLTATSKGAATREAILDRAYDIARFAGIEGLSIGPLAQAVGMSKSGVFAHFGPREDLQLRSEEHTSELQSLMRHSYSVFCLKNKNNRTLRQH